jgi:hypothetical protein
LNNPADPGHAAAFDKFKELLATITGTPQVE